MHFAHLCLVFFAVGFFMFLLTMALTLPIVGIYYLGKKVFK
jgi:hypothetical protein